MTRRCSVCGNPYYRSNRCRMWLVQAPGQRLGWVKEDIIVCTKCDKGAKHANRIMTIIQVHEPQKKLRRVS